MNAPERFGETIDPVGAGKRPVRVELVVPALEVAGMEMVVANLALGLRERGHDVSITCIEYVGPIGERLVSQGIPLRVVPTPGLWTLAFPNDLAAWFRRRRPDIVHVHSGAWLKAARAAMFGPARTVYTLHGIWPQPPWFVPAYTRLANLMTHTIVAVSTSLRDHLINDHGVRPSKIRVIENGVDARRFRPGPQTGAVRSRLNIPPGHFVFGTVARLHPVKNQALMVNAFALAHEQAPDTALVLVGDGALQEALQDHIARLNLEHAVFLFGSADELPPIYRDFNAFVLSSVIEGTSISALEAMASGVPVIATAVGGNPRLLGDGAHGLLVASNDRVALADAMLRCVRDRGLCQRLGASGRAAVERDHTLDRTTSRYVDVYRSVSRQHARAHRKPLEHHPADT